MNNHSTVVLVLSLSPFLGYCPQEPKKDLSLVNAFFDPQYPVYTDKKLNLAYDQCVMGDKASCNAAETYLKEIQQQELAQVKQIKTTMGKIADCLPRPCMTGCCIDGAFSVNERVSRLLPSEKHPCHYPLAEQHALATSHGFMHGYMLVPSRSFAFIHNWINNKLAKRIIQKHTELFAALADARRRCDAKNKAS